MIAHSPGLTATRQKSSRGQACSRQKGLVIHNGELPARTPRQKPFDRARQRDQPYLISHGRDATCADGLGKRDALTLPGFFTRNGLIEVSCSSRYPEDVQQSAGACLRDRIRSVHLMDGDACR